MEIEDLGDLISQRRHSCVVSKELESVFSVIETSVRSHDQLAPFSNPQGLEEQRFAPHWLVIERSDAIARRAVMSDDADCATLGDRCEVSPSQLNVGTTKRLARTIVVVTHDRAPRCPGVIQVGQLRPRPTALKT